MFEERSDEFANLGLNLVTVFNLRVSFSFPWFSFSLLRNQRKRKLSAGEGVHNSHLYVIKKLSLVKLIVVYKYDNFVYASYSLCKDVCLENKNSDWNNLQSV